jgi:acetolactate synthase-1/3 small subunit
MPQPDPKRSLYTKILTTEVKSEHIVVAIVEDKPGVFSRIAGLFRRRNFNIKSLTIGNCEHKGLSRMTIVIDGTKTKTEQVIKQLYKVIEVIKVSDLTFEETVIRELALVKIMASTEKRSEIMQTVDIFRGKIVDVGRDSVMVEITGDSKKVDSFLDLVKGFGIKELARTGVTAMGRGGEKTRL